MKNEKPSTFMSGPASFFPSSFPSELTKNEQLVWQELTEEWKTARDLHAAYPNLSFNTINNMFVRLERRGLIEGRKNDKLKIKEWRKK